MASGRVGGTKSKVTGTIGSEVYTLRRNPDGTYSQVVSAKAETVKYSNTELQAAQRMITAMVEGLMRDLKPVARISMQSGVNQSKSLNAFGSYNLNRLREDMVANWYGNQKFVYPVKDTDVRLGGTYTISAGTLHLNPNEVVSYGDGGGGWGFNGHKWFNIRVRMWYGIKINCNGSAQTLGALLRESGMSRGDVYVTAMNRLSFVYNPETEADDPVYSYQYSIIKLKDTLPDATPIEALEADDVFDVSTNGDAIFHFCKEERQFIIGLGLPFDLNDDQALYHASFVISRRNGFKQVSSSQFTRDIGSSEPWLLGAAPTNVFYSWVNEPYNPDWPSPFR